ncbi:MAG: NUDIX domain-containing protein [Sneathiella sp.]|nr:NUDIX domain-containing protein [Sneathiella sp.]
MTATTNNSAQAPRVGCGALIKNAAGEILLVKRKRAPEKDHWGFPGGKVDFGETAETATVREIREELGISIKLNSLAHLVNYIDIAEGQHWLAPVYTAVIISGTPEIREPDAISEMKWWSPADLPSPLTQATQQTLKIERA